MGRVGMALALVALSTTARAETAFVGVDVVVEDGILADRTVLVDGDRIVEVGPVDAVAVPEGAVVIDGAGRTLVPGLIDMHTHLAPAGTDALRRTLALMVAQGVTTARSMAGHPSHPDVRDAVERGDLLGPRLVLAAPPLHDQSAPTPDAARQAVRAARADGFDLVKVHHLEDRDVWQAAVDEARAQGLPVAGHLTHAVPLQHAIAAGQQIEHLDASCARCSPTTSATSPSASSLPRTSSRASTARASPRSPPRSPTGTSPRR